MKTAGKDAAKKGSARATLALALNWDGSRCPLRLLPAAARKFLQAGLTKAPSPATLAKLLPGKKIAELRICWVPRLAGGDDVLAAPFLTPDGRRVPFQAVSHRPFGDVLGVVYRAR